MATKPTREDHAAAAAEAIRRTAAEIGTALNELPEPLIFAERRKRAELNKGFAHQVAETYIGKLRAAEVEKAFAGAATEICARAETVELRQRATAKNKAHENALDVRSFLKLKVSTAVVQWRKSRRCQVEGAPMGSRGGECTKAEISRS